MYFWFFLVIVVSFLENWASTPFTSSWTMRVSRAPTNIVLPQEAHCVLRNNQDPERRELLSNTHCDDTGGSDIIDRLRSGINSQSIIRLSVDGISTFPTACFYVIVSKQEVSDTRAFLRVFCKASSLAVYAFGTALFAGALLMSITVASIILSVVLPAAAFGRMNGMFMAWEMNRNNDAILHAIVKSKKEAAEHIESILAQPNLLVEIMGHIIVDGKVVARQNPWTSLASYIGFLAPPFNLYRLAAKRPYNPGLQGIELSKPGTIISSRSTTQIGEAV